MTQFIKLIKTSRKFSLHKIILVFLILTTLTISQTIPAIAEIEGQRWGLLIGISDYAPSGPGGPDLNYADDDANDIYQVLNACHQFAVSNDGTFPSAINTTPTDIGTGGLNLGDDLVPAYIPAMPYDPADGAADTTEYVLFEEADGRLTATASSAELGEAITITR